MCSSRFVPVTPKVSSMMHWAVHTELVVERPVREVWPLFKDMGRWYTKYAFEVLSGPPYEEGPGLTEGQVLKLTSSMGLPWSADAAVAGPQNLIARVIRVAEQNDTREIVVYLSGSAYDWKRYTLFYVLRSVEGSGATTIIVNAYGEAEFVAHLSEVELTAYREQFTQGWQASWSEAFESFKRIINAEGERNERSG
jgi:hypothetical protein